jgi:hypothetical protein
MNEHLYVNICSDPIAPVVMSSSTENENEEGMEGEGEVKKKKKKRRSKKKTKNTTDDDDDEEVLKCFSAVFIYKDICIMHASIYAGMCDYVYVFNHV